MMATDAASSTRTSPAVTRRRPAYVVKSSGIHGKGAFANRPIAAGSRIAEYTGERITASQSASRHGRNRDNPFHTFFFSLENGKVIDGARGGNNARWINHGCAPNCEAREENGRIFIHALRDIAEGEELCYDYGLMIDERYTPALKRAYACHCGAPSCRKTMLAPKRRSASKG